MRLTLRIENCQTLPDGGPTSFSVVGQQGFDIGRGQYLDWTLPDEQLEISGRHCEIRPQGGAYLLYDVSRNGTFVNGSDVRVQSPYRLKSGDRLGIGPYIISVTVDADAPIEPEAAPIVTRPASPADIWDFDGEAAPPIKPQELAPKRAATASYGDWLDQPADAERFLPAARAEARSSVDPAGVTEPGSPLQPVPARRPEGSSASPAFDENAPFPSPAPVGAPKTPGLASVDPWARESRETLRESWDPAPPAPVPPAPSPLGRVQAPAAEEPPPPLSSAGESAGDYAEFLSALGRASGAPVALYAPCGAAALGEQMGALLRLLVDEIRQLLEARSAAKRMARTVNQTVIQARDNNPLKFSPTSDEALRILFGPPRSGYLDAGRAFTEAFADLKSHQLHTYAAMRDAVRLLAEDLDPGEIDKSLGKDSGLASVIGSRKARLWDAYLVRWDAKTRHADDGLVDAFMRYYADCYERAERGHKPTR